jgi:hypothetical protein
MTEIEKEIRVISPREFNKKKTGLKELRWRDKGEVEKSAGTFCQRRLSGETDRTILIIPSFPFSLWSRWSI